MVILGAGNKSDVVTTLGQTPSHPLLHQAL